VAEKSNGCVQPARRPLGVSLRDASAKDRDNEQSIRKEEQMVARVGQAAPDFEASAFLGGNFKNIKLSDFKGQWVVLCFYPGDFTFV
jgi:hypothetical protein